MNLLMLQLLYRGVTKLLLVLSILFKYVIVCLARLMLEFGEPLGVGSDVCDDASEWTPESGSWLS